MAKVVDAHVEVAGLREFQREVKRLAAGGEKEAFDKFKDANFEVARFVKDKARVRAAGAGKIAMRGWNDMSPVRSGVSAQLVANKKYAQVNEFHWFGGSEFGAKQNVRRLVKEQVRKAGRPRKDGSDKNVRTSRARATSLKESDDIGTVSRRVESQFATKSGKTVAKREAGARQVQLKRRSGGGVYVVRGWNQFRPWRGNGARAGYWLYPTIRDNIENIGEMYQDELEKIMKPAFDK